jgi:hypothetical protein
MGVIGIAEAGIHETWVVAGSHFVKEIVSDFSAFGRLFSTVHELIHCQYGSLMEIHDAKIVEATVYVKIDLSLYAFEIFVK